MIFDTLLGVLYPTLSPIDGFYSAGHESCTVVIHKWAALLAGGYDIIISIILLVLFLRPLVLLNHEMKREYQYDYASSRHLTVRKGTDSNTTTSFTASKSRPSVTLTASRISIDLKAAPFDDKTSMHSTPSDVTPDSDLNDGDTVFMVDVTSKPLRQMTSCEMEDIDEERELDRIKGNQSESEISEIEPVATSRASTSWFSKRISTESSNSGSSQSQMTGHYGRLDTVYQELITRYAVLVSLCIGSSLLLYLIMISIGHYMPYLLSIIVCMDDALNVWCIILINKQQNVLYHRLCRPCNAVMRCCCDGLDRRRMRKDKTLTVGTVSSEMSSVIR